MFVSMKTKSGWNMGPVGLKPRSQGQVKKQEIPEGSWRPPSNDFLMFFLYLLLSTKLSFTYMTQTQSDFKTRQFGQIYRISNEKYGLYLHGHVQKNFQGFYFVTYMYFLIQCDPDSNSSYTSARQIFSPSLITIGTKICSLECKQFSMLCPHDLVFDPT